MLDMMTQFIPHGRNKHIATPTRSIAVRRLVCPMQFTAQELPLLCFGRWPLWLRQREVVDPLARATGSLARMGTFCSR